MEKWFVSMKKADFTQIAEKYHISPIIARLIRNRDILGDQNIDYYLNGTIADLHDGMLMKNMDKDSGGKNPRRRKNPCDRRL